MALSDRPNGPATIAASSSNQSGLNVQAALASPLPATLTLTAVTAAVVLNPQNPALALVCPLSPTQGNEATPFDLWASGTVVTGNATNVVGKLGVGTSTTDATNTALGSSSATAVGTTSANWKVHCELLYDSVSGKLTGTIEWLINNVLTAKAALANVVTGIKDTNNPVANFVLSFSSSAAAGGAAATTVVVKKFSVG
jgi:hypothetical protein